MSDFYDIYPPPQTIDTLPVWGDIDHLPYSLDSAIWQTVGVYGLDLDESASASCSVTCRVDVYAEIHGEAQSDCEISVPLVSEAHTQAVVDAQVVCNADIDILAESVEVLVWQRIRNSSASALAETDDSAHCEIFGHGWHDAATASGDWEPIAASAQGWHVIHTAGQNWLGKAI